MTKPDDPYAAAQEAGEEALRVMMEDEGGCNQVTTCKCGRVGECSSCCCAWWEHRAYPTKPCSLCGHGGQVGRST